MNLLAATVSSFYKSKSKMPEDLRWWPFDWEAFDLFPLEFVRGFMVWVHMHWAYRRLESYVVASDTPAVCTETPI